MPLPERVETKLIRDLSSGHGIRKILLIGEDKEKRFAKFLLLQQALKLFTSLGDTVTIIRVDNIDDTLAVLIVYIS